MQIVMREGKWFGVSTKKKNRNGEWRKVCGPFDTKREVTAWGKMRAIEEIVKFKKRRLSQLAPPNGIVTSENISGQENTLSQTSTSQPS